MEIKEKCIHSDIIGSPSYNTQKDIKTRESIKKDLCA